jgi:nickel-type superoxide dismutase maturation protease
MGSGFQNHCPFLRMYDQIPTAGIFAKIKLYFGRLQGFAIEGDSMLPTLKPGDRVLIDERSSLSVGDIAVVRHPFKTSVKIVKRVESIQKDGSVSLIGDNPEESSDSRGFGSIKREDIIGQVVFRLR